MNITNIQEKYNSLSFNLTQRFTTAFEMYNLMLKLNTEQETGGEFDTLTEKLREEFLQYEVHIDLSPQFFTGREDVIFELSVYIQLNKDSKLDNKDLLKEFVLGTILKYIKDHFNFYYRHSDSSIEVVKHYFRNY